MSPSPARSGRIVRAAAPPPERLLAGFRLEFTADSPEIAAMLDPWLDLFVTEGAEGAPTEPLTFDVTVVPDEAMRAEAAPDARPLVDYLYVSGWVDRGRPFYRGTDGSTLELDPETARAACRVPQSAISGPPWVLRDLFNAALTTFLRRRGRHPLHAALVARDGEGLLIAGAPMAGKTSLSLNFLRRGWSWVADDKVLLSQAKDGDVEAGGLFRHFNIDPGLIAYFPELAGIVENAPLYPHSEKRGAHIEEIYGHRRVRAARPRWILLPRVVDLGPTTVEEMDPEAAFLELLRQMPLINDAASTREGARLLARLSASARSFRLHMGRDVLEDPDRLSRIAASIGVRAGSPSVGT